MFEKDLSSDVSVCIMLFIKLDDVLKVKVEDSVKIEKKMVVKWMWLNGGVKWNFRMLG